MSDTTGATRDLTVSRDIPAPVDQAWKSWSDPAYVLRWWGPNGFECTLAELDVRDGVTRLTVTEQGYTDDEQLALSKQGLEESLDKLVAIYA
jgi:uncharacterized protein YndB with AHSA1/START domain